MYNFLYVFDFGVIPPAQIPLFTSVSSSLTNNKGRPNWKAIEGSNKEDKEVTLKK